MSDDADKVKQEAIDVFSQSVNSIDMSGLAAYYNQVMVERMENALFAPVSTGSTITWRKGYKDITDEQVKKEQDLDKRRQLKIWMHFSKLFVERFPQWELRPDPKDPFSKVTMAHKTKPYLIESAYPSNEVRIFGVPLKSSLEKFNTTPFNTVYGWALGLEDVPEWVTNE